MIANYLMGSGILYNREKTHESKNTLKMKPETTEIDELKQLIGEELKDCNGFLWPKVCELQSTPNGKTKLEGMIVRLVADEGMGIGSAIAHIEQELSHII